MFKFTLLVAKFKCINCDLLFLVEKKNDYEGNRCSCPFCNSVADKMEDNIVMVQKMKG